MANMVFGKGSGHGIMVDFIEEFSKALMKHFNRYRETTNTPPFWYGEQQTKTFVTLALGEICNSAVLQEPPIIRKITKKKRHKKHKQKIEIRRNGKVDYSCTFNEQNIMIEIKHSWISYTEEKLSLGSACKAHSNCYRQVNRVKAESFRAYNAKKKLAISLLPFYTKHQKLVDGEFIIANSPKELTRSDDDMLKIVSDTLKEQHTSCAELLSAISVIKLPERLYVGEAQPWQAFIEYDDRKWAYLFFAIFWSWKDV